MLTNYCLSIINAPKEQKTKAGKYKMSDLNRSLLDKFIAIDADKEWMESTEYTKLTKVLASAVIVGSDLNGCPIGTKSSVAKEGTRENYKTAPHSHFYSHKIGVSIYDSVIQLTLERQQNSLDLESVWADEDIDWIKLMVARVTALRPIHDKFVAIGKRLTRNGKFPKEEAERRRRTEIKGKLNKDLARELTIVKNDWIQIIKKFNLDHSTMLVEKNAEFLTEFNEIIKSKFKVSKERKEEIRQRLQILSRVIKPDGDGLYSFKTPEELDKQATDMATFEGEEFYFKMADKLGGLVTDNVKLLSLDTVKDGITPFSNFMHFKFENNTSFSIENKIIVNRSPLNLYFFQYPCTFYNCRIKGVELKGASEITVKQAFLN